MQVSTMEITRKYFVLDAPDLAAESSFWAAVLGGTVEVGSVGAEDDWHTVVVDGQEALGIQLAPDHVRPEWPQGPQRQQIHLDLYIRDLRDAHREVTDLGAELLQATEDPTAAHGFQVYADPAGHPFCLCWD